MLNYNTYLDTFKNIFQSLWLHVDKALEVFGYKITK